MSPRPVPEPEQPVIVPPHTPVIDPPSPHEPGTPGTPEPQHTPVIPPGQPVINPPSPEPPTVVPNEPNKPFIT